MKFELNLKIKHYPFIQNVKYKIDYKQFKYYILVYCILTKNNFREFKGYFLSNQITLYFSRFLNSKFSNSMKNITRAKYFKGIGTEKHLKYHRVLKIGYVKST